MTKPLAMDIRTGVMARTVAQALGVAPSSVVTWSERRRMTGSAAPVKIAGHVPRKIRGAEADWLRARMGEGDFTFSQRRGTDLDHAGHLKDRVRADCTQSQSDRVQLNQTACNPLQLERVAFNQVHLIERNSQHYQRLACLGLHSI
ncbi:MAG: hypothetical protein WCS20_06345 [Alphaproteobacteria bacterium]